MREVFTRNISLKILSLLLAILLWVAIMNIDDPYITKTIDNIRVTTINTNALEDNNKMYEVESGDVAVIKVRGKQSVLDSLTRNDFVAVADFKQMSMTYAVPIQITLKETSRFVESDIEIVRQTEMMSLTLEDYDAQTFRIKVLMSGQVKEGFCATEAVATPNIIEIRGSKRQIARIKDVIVRVDVTGRSESFQTTKTVIAYDDSGYLVESSKLIIENTEVKVDVRVLPTKEIRLFVTQDGTPMHGYECTEIVFKPEKITIAATTEKLASSYMLRIPVDVEGKSETVVSEVNLEDYLGDEYYVVDENKSIAITAKIEKLETKEIVANNTDIMVKNLQEAYTIEYVNVEPMTLRVSGLPIVLEKLTITELAPYINVGGLEPGMHSVQIESNIMEGVSLQPMVIYINIMQKNS